MVQENIIFAIISVLNAFKTIQSIKSVAMSFPIGEDTLYVYAEPDADDKELPTKIIETIQS